jgi:hypothetical protein
MPFSTNAVYAPIQPYRQLGPWNQPMLAGGLSASATLKAGCLVKLAGSSSGTLVEAALSDSTVFGVLADPAQAPTGQTLTPFVVPAVGSGTPITGAVERRVIPFNSQMTFVGSLDTSGGSASVPLQASDIGATYALSPVLPNGTVGLQAANPSAIWILDRAGSGTGPTAVALVLNLIDPIGSIADGVPQVLSNGGQKSGHALVEFMIVPSKRAV